MILTEGTSDSKPTNDSTASPSDTKAINDPTTPPNDEKETNDHKQLSNCVFVFIIFFLL